MPVININKREHYYEIHHPYEAKTILFVHGHPFNCSQWKYQIDALKKFKLLMPDLRGYGQTFDNKSKHIFIEEHAKELSLLLEKLNIDTVHLIGLSMGGQIIASFAHQFPERVHSLMLCNTLPFAESEASKASRILAGNQLLEKGMEQHVKQDIAKYIHPHTYNQNNEVLIHLKEMMLSTNAVSAAANHFGRAERMDYATFLREFDKPLHFICGELDNFTPAKKMIDFANSIAPNLYSIISNSGHLTNMENPSIFNKILIDFYSKFFYK